MRDKSLDTLQIIQILCTLTNFKQILFRGRPIHTFILFIDVPMNNPIGFKGLDKRINHFTIRDMEVKEQNTTVLQNLILSFLKNIKFRVKFKNFNWDFVVKQFSHSLTLSSHIIQKLASNSLYQTVKPKLSFKQICIL